MNKYTYVLDNPAKLVVTLFTDHIKLNFAVQTPVLIAHIIRQSPKFSKNWLCWVRWNYVWVDEFNCHIIR